MGIKPALGWLALLLFTTSAQAEGAREVLKHAPKTKTPSVAAPVTPKTKAAGPVVVVAAPSPSPSLVVLESTTKARGDYEAETYSGVPLDAPFAKERGLDKGLVTMVFEHQQRPAFRVGRDRIRRVLRLAADADRTLTLVRASTVTARPKDHLDVLDTEDGMIVVDTTTANAGMFTTSEVYAFARNAVTLEQRIAALEAIPSPARDRIRQALVIAEWSH